MDKEGRKEKGKETKRTRNKRVGEGKIEIPKKGIKRNELREDKITMIC